MKENAQNLFNMWRKVKENEDMSEKEFKIKIKELYYVTISY